MRPQPSPTYRALQQDLQRGWNTWDTRSVLRQVLLPEGFAVSLGLHELYRGRTLQTAQIGRREPDDEQVRFGPHDPRGRYSNVRVDWAEITIEVESAQVGDDLVWLITPLASQARPALLTVSAAYLWQKPGVADRDGDVLVGRSGDRQVTVHVTGAPVVDPYADAMGPYLSVELSGPVGLSTGAARTVEEITALIRAAAAEHCPPARTELDEHRELVRDSIAWNTIYEPSDDRVVTTVSRLWNVGKRGGFALFCWDNFFNALLADVHSTELAYANAIEICREVTPEGFVPNVAQGTGRVTIDGSQPPVGSLVCWELYRRHRDRWFLEEVFDVLLSWNRWWWRVRHNGVMLSPGSTWFEPEFPSPQDIPRIHQHFGATCETGADDHPVFRDVPFDEETSLLRAHDIGLNAEYVADCEALARIADELGRAELAVEVRGRGAELAKLIDDRLWDAEAGCYRSHFSDSGRPTAWLSPMSFFPLLAGLGADDHGADDHGTPGRAAEMTRRYLREPDGFGGQWVLPSSPRSELATMPGAHSYWVGRAWPPINFLVYLGLRRVGLADDAAWLAERSGDLAMLEWRDQRHIHENYSSEHGLACDKPNSEPFHSWGALLSLTYLVAAGDVPYGG